MFRCAKCASIRPVGEKQNKVIVRTKDKEYLDSSGNVIGKGCEVLEEIALGKCCYVEE